MNLAGLEGADTVWNEDDAADYTVPDIQKITKQNNVLPVWNRGNQHSMNLNSLVLENITSSPYFKTNLTELTTYHEILNEIYYNVTHLEPWERGTRKTTGMTGMCGGVRGVGAGGVVSTAYCLLYRLYTLKLTRKQLVSMINYNQSCYIRGLGFMYIRYCQPPKDFWAWFEPYLDDEEKIDPKAGGGEPITIGQMLKMLLAKLDWYGYGRGQYTIFGPIWLLVAISTMFTVFYTSISQKEIELHLREKARWIIQQRSEEAERRQKEREAEREKERLEKEKRRSRSRERTGRERDGRTRDRRSRSRDSPDRKRRRHERSRSGSRSRRRSPEQSERKTEKRRNPYKCSHHMKYHHCRKHKTRCSRRKQKTKET